jgi:mycothiol synthase
MDLINSEHVQLPEGFNIRPARFDDLQGVVDLVTTVDMDERGHSDVSPEDLLIEWKSVNFNLETDAWVVEWNGRSSEKPGLAGYAEVWNRSEHAMLQGDGYVHPECRGKGIGTTLLRLQEARARQHIPLAQPDLRVILRNGMDVNDTRGRELHENEGFQPIRYFYRMQIDLGKAPPEAQWPSGIELRPFRTGQDERAAFDAVHEAFKDHWGYTPWIYEQWSLRMTDRESFDPTLFFIAWDGEQIAGASLCQTRQDGGWVQQLAVRRPWRRLGLGKALLQHTISEFFRRGVRSIALGVDAENPTGATRLYEQAGMRVVHQFVVYEKELRPGRVEPG